MPDRPLRLSRRGTLAVLHDDDELAALQEALEVLHNEHAVQLLQNFDLPNRNCYLLQRRLLLFVLHALEMHLLRHVEMVVVVANHQIGRACIATSAYRSYPCPTPAPLCSDRSSVRGSSSPVVIYMASTVESQYNV